MTEFPSSLRLAPLAGLIAAGFLLVGPGVTPAFAGPDARQEYRGAVIELEQRLQQNPGDVTIRQQLALVNLDWGRGAEAEQYLRKAIGEGGSPEALFQPLLESLLVQGKYKEVVYEKLPLADLPTERLASLLALRGQAWLGLNEPDKAEKEIDRALKVASGNPEAKLARARLEQSRGQLAVADQRVSEVLATTPGNANAWSLKGALLEAARQPRQAEEAYSRAIDLRRFSPIDRASRAILRIDAGRLAEAREDLDILKREASTGFLTHYAEGLMALKTGRYADAQTSFELALKLNDRFHSTQYYLGVAHFQQGHDQQAEEHLQTFAALRPDISDAQVMLASVKFRRGRRDEARAILNTILAQHPDHLGALRLSSDLEFLSGNRKKGLEQLRRAAELAPRQRQALTGATDQFKTDGAAALTAGNDAAHEVAARILAALRKGSFDEARAEVVKFRASVPDGPLPDHFSGLIALAESAPDQAKVHFEAALAKNPGDPVLSQRLAELALRKQDYAAARKLYDAALAQHPDDYATLMHLAELSGREGKPAEMEAQLTALIQKHPTALEPRLTLADHLLDSGQPSRAEALLEEIRDGYPHHLALGILLVKAQVANHQAGPALTTAKALVADAPASALAHYLLANAYAANGNRAQARTALDKAVAVDRQFLPARYTAIRWLVGEGDFGRANQELQSLVSEYPKSVEIMLLRSWVEASQHHFPGALQAAEAAWAVARTPETVMVLAKARWQAGDRAAGLAVLEEWIKAHPADAGARVAVADLYAADNRQAAAVAHLEEVLKAHPDNVLVLNNLAWLYRDIDAGKALMTARRAAAMAPHAPAVLDTLAMLELERGQADKAVELLKHAAAQKEAGGVVHYHLALALERGGKHPEAMHAIKDALAYPRAFSERKDAIALLAKLSGS